MTKWQICFCNAACTADLKGWCHNLQTWQPLFRWHLREIVTPAEDGLCPYLRSGWAPEWCYRGCLLSMWWCYNHQQTGVSGWSLQWPLPLDLSCCGWTSDHCHCLSQSEEDKAWWLKTEGLKKGKTTWSHLNSENLPPSWQSCSYIRYSCVCWHGSCRCSD